MYVFEKTGGAHNPLKSTKQNDQNIKFCYTSKLMVPFLSFYFSCLFMHAENTHKCAKMELLVSSKDSHYIHLPKGPFEGIFSNTNIFKNSKNE